MANIVELKKLVEKYKNDIDYYQSTAYNETQLRTDFLDHFFTLLGWDITNSGGKPTYEREVLVEEGLKARAGEHSKKPDYTFRLFSERKFFVEAKKPSVDISRIPESARQVRRYGFTAKLKISVLSNFEYTAIYDCSGQVNSNDGVDFARIKLYHYSELEDCFGEIQRLIGRESVYSGQFDNEWLEIESKIARFSVDDLFLKQINEWRLLLANEFLLIKPDLSEEKLNDMAQNYINSIVFLRVCEDRELEDYETLNLFAKNKDFAALINKLQSADKKYNSGLFALDYIDVLLKNENSNIFKIIEQLYYPYSTYSFSVLSSDVLGNIYEIFLSEKLKIDIRGEISIQPKEEHLDRDVVTTPNYIVKDIIRNTVVEYCKGKNDKDILKSRFADIACGSGSFLLEVFQTLQDILVDYYQIHDRSQLQQLTVHSFKLNLALKKELLTSCIFGVDKDYNAIKACTFGLLLKLLEGESKESIGVNKPILPTLTNNILFGNSLIDDDDAIKDVDRFSVNPFNLHDYVFDVIVGNPPYMATEHMKQFNPAELPIYKKKYKSAFKQFDKYYLFVERSMQVLKEGGYAGYILPSKFTRVGSGKNLRKFLTDNSFLNKLIYFGSNQVFKNKTTYTCLLFLRKTKQKKFDFYEVKDFRKWLTREDRILFSGAYETSSLDSDTWVLEKETNDILRQMWLKSGALGDILGSGAIANGIQTSANDYYIHRPIRSDDKYVYFNWNEKDFHVEKALTRPYFVTQRSSDDHFYTYKDVEPNAFVIYPYQKVEGCVRLVEFNHLEHVYPKMFAFLQIIKEHLDKPSRSIKPDPITPHEWYRYGRSQALENCDVDQKLIVGVLSNGYKYAIDNQRTFVSSGGTAGYSIINIPEDCLYSIFYIQAILSSRYLEWFASIYGEIFRGGFIARGTKVQTRMPVPCIDFTDPVKKMQHDDIAVLQKKMNQLYAQIINSDVRQKVILERQFEGAKKQMNELIKALFELGELDKKIPSVEEIYNAL